MKKLLFALFLLTTLFGCVPAYSQGQQNDAFDKVATGTNTYSVTINSIIVASPYNGQKIWVLFPNANTGASTLKVTGAGSISYTASAITLNGSALVANDIPANVWMELDYYATGTSWQLQRSGAGAASVDWHLLGNSSTVDGTNFLGTTDDIPLNFRVNNQRSGRITNNVDATDVNSTFFGYQSGLNSTNGNNTAIGATALKANTTGGNNTAIGSSSLFTNTSGASNVSIGFESMYSNTTGAQDVSIGMDNLYSNTKSAKNVSIGFETMKNNTNAGSNVAVGYQSLYTQSFTNANTIYDSYNVALGYQALYTNNPTAAFAGIATNGSANTAVGSFALSANTIGVANTSVGLNSSFMNTIGGSNCSFGYEAMKANTTASRNTAIGLQALQLQSFSNAGVAYNSDNIAIGYQALLNNQPTLTTNGIQNTVVGNLAGTLNVIGSQNTMLGYNAEVANGFTNATAIGANSSETESNSMTFGDNNVTKTKFNGALMPFYSAAYNAGTSGQVLTSQGVSVAPQWVTPSTSATAWQLLGNSGLVDATNFLGTTAAAGDKPLNFRVENIKAGRMTGDAGTSDLNTAFFGSEAGLSNTTGDDNTGMGSQSLQNTTIGTGNTALGYSSGFTNITGTLNTFIGTGADALVATNLTNATAIGANALVATSNSMVLGDGLINVGIGTSSPAATLHIVGSSGSTLRVVDGNQGVGKTLISDANGTATWTAIAASASVTVTDDTTNSSTVYPTWVTATGSRPIYISSERFQFIPSVGTMAIGNLGLATALTGLQVTDDFGVASIANLVHGIKSAPLVRFSSNAAGNTFMGVRATPTVNFYVGTAGAKTMGSMKSFVASPKLQNVSAVDARAVTLAAGFESNLDSILSVPSGSTLTFGGYRHFYAKNAALITSSTITAEYGLYIDAFTAGSGTLTNPYGVVSGAGNRNGFGTLVPTAIVHLGAGSDITNGAPLKFTSGALTTGGNITAGSVEFLTDKWYGTITTGTAQKEFTMNDAALTSGTVPVATTNGRLTDGLVISNGTYTPTLTNTTNIAASTAYTLFYTRIGSNVFVYGTIDIDPTTAVTFSRLDITVPIATNFTTATQAGGTGASAVSNVGTFTSDAASDKIFFYMTTNASVANQSFNFNFNYSIQ